MRDDQKGKRFDLPSLEGLRELHSLPIAILGGGSTLLVDYSKTPGNSIVVAVNHHASDFVRAEYLVLCDKPSASPELQKVYDESRKRMSYMQDYSDFNLDIPVWYDGMAMTTAIWFACYITSGAVFLCGVDCCTVKPTHYGGRHNKQEFDKPLKDKMRPILATLEHVRNKERVIALQPPLRGLW